MSELTISNSVSLLTLILPKESVDLVSKAISKCSFKMQFQISLSNAHNRMHTITFSF